MKRFANIVNCVVIREFDDAICADLEAGGHNVIEYEGCLWIPNMSSVALAKAKKLGYMSKCYYKEDEISEDAPIICMCAIDAHLSQSMDGMTPEQMEDFIDRLINAEGFAGHYNRHRYKMPHSFLK